MREMRSIAIILVTTLLAGGGLASAQTPEDRIAAALATAGEMRIPVELLQDIVVEGQAKGAALDRIADAVARRLAALERASEALGGQSGVGAADLAAVADAHESGISDTVLEAVFDNAPRERRAVAIAALTQLVADGHVPAEALDRVIAALARGNDALLSLPGQAAGSGAGAPAGIPAGPPAGVPAPGGVPQGGHPAGPPAGAPIP
jgi:hypothetical protein